MLLRHLNLDPLNFLLKKKHYQSLFILSIKITFRLKFESLLLLLLLLMFN